MNMPPVSVQKTQRKTQRKTQSVQKTQRKTTTWPGAKQAQYNHNTTTRLECLEVAQHVHVVCTHVLQSSLSVSPPSLDFSQLWTRTPQICLISPRAASRDSLECSTTTFLVGLEEQNKSREETKTTVRIFVGTVRCSALQCVKTGRQAGGRGGKKKKNGFTTAAKYPKDTHPHNREAYALQLYVYGTHTHGGWQSWVHDCISQVSTYFAGNVFGNMVARGSSTFSAAKVRRLPGAMALSLSFMFMMSRPSCHFSSSVGLFPVVGKEKNTR